MTTRKKAATRATISAPFTYAPSRTNVGRFTIPPGHVLVHNSVRPSRIQGNRGARF